MLHNPLDVNILLCYIVVSGCASGNNTFLLIILPNSVQILLFQLVAPTLTQPLQDVAAIDLMTTLDENRVWTIYYIEANNNYNIEFSAVENMRNANDYDDD